MSKLNPFTLAAVLVAFAVPAAVYQPATASPAEAEQPTQQVDPIGYANTALQNAALFEARHTGSPIELTLVESNIDLRVNSVSTVNPDGSIPKSTTTATGPDGTQVILQECAPMQDMGPAECLLTEGSITTLGGLQMGEPTPTDTPLTRPMSDRPSGISQTIGSIAESGAGYEVTVTENTYTLTLWAPNDADSGNGITITWEALPAR